MKATTLSQQQKKDRTTGLFITSVIATLLAFILFNTFIVHGARNQQATQLAANQTPANLTLIEIPLESVLQKQALSGSGAFQNPHATSSFKAGKGGDVAGTNGNPFGGNAERGTSELGNDDASTVQAKKQALEKRQLIQKPNTNTIHTDEDCTLTFSVRVNSDGIIVGSPTFQSSLSTTGNSAVIQQVKQLLKAETRWNKSSNAAMYQTTISVKLTAN
jgi:hypothetical protein